ncbi:dTDP-4-dehydrorhamnose reductase [Luteimicrobium subarcticum]|uniref:dTDP-4-dehydrorhamnose reductase n=1 Tax=Luteimicrobium subarcticum TaxID=620910 RepID=A0A2M8WTH2_9MICO|nr:dTDP-4-dehydrorhamnose reductase [Luteimicrobium subarcticum]PJI94250.1 dTDP-4-dehydrorhamnose reductase [Luteimicrobium subarcticum]
MQQGQQQRWVVVGAAGMLGQDLVAVLADAGRTVRGTTRADLDVTDAAACRAAVRDADVVVNAAAYTRVDDAETDEGAAFAVNAVGAQHLAAACAAAGARLVHVSTDYVLDGTSTTPCPEDAPLAPRSAYGRTKAAGEWAVRASGADALVVRTAWLYGAGGPSFPRTIARLARERGGVDVVDDQRGQPTWTRDVARVVRDLVAVGAPAGTYHATSSGDATWFDLAREVVASAGLDPAVVRPTTSAAFVRPAPRPAYSVLAHDTLRAVGVPAIGAWCERWALAAADVLGDPPGGPPAPVA